MNSIGEEVRGRGVFLVLLQGLLFLCVGVTAVLPGPTLWQSLVVGLLLVVVGAAGVLWSGRYLGRSLTPMPVPNGEGLVAAGPYRLARHPMYTALVLVCLGVAVGAGATWSYVSVLVLALFFEVKSRVEERYLLAAYPGYAEYAARTGKFVPGIGRRRLSTG